MIAKQH